MGVNDTSPVTYGIFATLVLAALITVGIFAHASLLCWIVSLFVWTAGIAVMIGEIAKGGDTDKIPYVIQFGGALVMILWQAFSQ